MDLLRQLPVGAIALALALRLLPDTPRSPAKLDVPGLVLLSGGIAVFLYGLAKIGTGTAGGAQPGIAMAAGLAMVAAFCWYALHVRKPLIDLRLLRRRGFAAGAAANLMLGIALFGGAAAAAVPGDRRGRSPLQTGLLLIPQGLGAALVMLAAGALTTGSAPAPWSPGASWWRWPAPPPTPSSARSPATGTWQSRCCSSVPGWARPSRRHGGRVRRHRPPAIPAAAAAIGTIQRIAGSLGTALLAVTLQHAIGARLPASWQHHRRGALGCEVCAVGRFWPHRGLAGSGARPARTPQLHPAAPQARHNPEPAEARQ